LNVNGVKIVETDLSGLRNICRRNVCQPDGVLADQFIGQESERRPRAGEEWSAATNDDGADVEPILIDETPVGQASRQVWPANVNLPVELRLEPAYKPLDVIRDKCSVGADRLERPRHNPLWLAPPQGRELAVLRVPVSMVIVPIPHDLVHAATVHTPGEATLYLVKVTSDQWTGWPKYHVVNVAVQGLRQSEYNLGHTYNIP
jgi:hypothetical protein